MALESYNSKRDFQSTPEPEGVLASSGRRARFVVQEHHARNLHFDLRLEMGGVLKSWAVPKGPSLVPGLKRLAVPTEDHPLRYIDFEGTIPEGNYGAGRMVVWDTGYYEVESGDPLAEYDAGKIKINFHGKILRGHFTLVQSSRGGQWLLLKSKDEFADESWSLTTKVLPKTQGEPVSGRARPRSGPGLPETIQPMLATLVKEMPRGKDWIYEIKWDGYRSLAYLQQEQIRLISRNQLDMTAKFPEITAELEGLGLSGCVLDGEIVALGEDGRPSFQRLQNRAGLYTRKKKSGRSSSDRDPQTAVVYYIFDVLFMDGKDLRNLPLLQRREFLTQMLGTREADSSLQLSDYVPGEKAGSHLLDHARALGLEGIMAKRADSGYRETRSPHWQKIKLLQETDVLIAGYTEPRGTRLHFGALLLGAWEDGKLRFMGHVGTGFDSAQLKMLHELMQPLRQETCPFEQEPPTNEPAVWLQPELVCSVSYSQLTQDGILRHPVFQRMRPDKDAAECEPPAPEDTAAQGQKGAGLTMPTHAKPKANARAGRSPAKQTRSARLSLKQALAMKLWEKDLTVEVQGAEVHLTNLDMVYWPEEGYTKGQLLRYYAQMAPRVLPHLQDRPLILQRFPNGVDAAAFHQHNVEDAPPFLQTFEVQGEGGTNHYAVCNNLASLLYLVNLGTIAQHAWMSRTEHPDRPDWVVFDLDPGKSSWEMVCELALVVKDIVESLGLKCYAKTSGSRGLHVYVPLLPNLTYDELDPFTELLARAVVAERPDLATVERALKKRPEKLIYLDYLQNKEGKTVASPYSVRAKPGAKVSMPLSWTAVKAVPDPMEFTMITLPDQKLPLDPFSPVLKKPQNLKTALKHLEKLAS